MVHLINGCLENSDAELLVIPHSTSGTASTNFDSILDKFGLLHAIPTADIGTVTIAEGQKAKTGGRFVAFACSVNDFASSYTALYQIIGNLIKQIPLNVIRVALPILGAGAGGLVIFTM